MNNKFVIVTSFSENGYKTYGRAFIDSFIKFWPKQVQLICYHHSDYPVTKKWEPVDFPKANNIEYFDMDQIKELVLFKDFASTVLKSKVPPSVTQNGTPWQLDAVKFTNKVFALQNANVNVGGNFEWIIWLDADTITNKPVKVKDIEEWVSGENVDIVHLPRACTYYSETSFVAFRTSNNRVRVFLDNLMSTFLSGEFQFYGEWHDGFIFERLLNIHRWNGLVTKSLTSPDCKTLEAFQSSKLAEFMTHFKGNKKYAAKEAPKVLEEKKTQSGDGLMAFKVQPHDCVPQAALKDNINENMSLIKPWMTFVKPHNSTAIIASAGPSLKSNMKHIKKAQKKGAKVFCVKHSYPMLIEAGIIPDYCVILDPREIDGVSTHGKVRKDLFKDASKQTKFLVASMTHPSVTKYFLDNGFDVIGWHALTGELQAVFKEKEKELNKHTVVSVQLGTCSAMRALGVAEILGFRSYELCGFDSSIQGTPDNPDEKLDTGMPKYYEVSLLADNPQVFKGRSEAKGSQVFWTTGELVALYQDFMGIVPMVQNHMKSVKVLLDDTTLCGAGWKRLTKLSKERMEKEELQKKNIEKSMTLEEFHKACIPCYN